MSFNGSSDRTVSKQFWPRSGQPSLVWVWVWKMSPKNPKFFNFFPFVLGQKNIYWGSKVCLGRVGSGPISRRFDLHVFHFHTRTAKPNLTKFWMGTASCSRSVLNSVCTLPHTPGGTFCYGQRKDLGDWFLFVSLLQVCCRYIFLTTNAFHFNSNENIFEKIFKARMKFLFSVTLKSCWESVTTIPHIRWYQRNCSCKNFE